MVKPDADGKWLPVRDEHYGEAAYVSHNLQREVDCARCHYAGNAWGLRVK